MTAATHPYLLVAPPRAAPRFLPLLLLLFIASGCSALIYEIVWLQLLQLVIGSTAVSLGVLLGTFMGGMCLGSLLLPRLISPVRHPLRVYAFLELGIGVIGILLLYGLPMIDRLYAALAGAGTWGICVRAFVTAFCLLPPTLLMGATLPAIARWVQTTPRGVSWLGFFYAGNTFGAVVGCLLAGFYLLRIHDMATATGVAAALNAAVGFVALLLSAFMPHQSRSNDAILETNSSDLPTPSAAPLAAPCSTWPLYLAIALSGFSALGAEVVWTRLMSLTLGGTTYAFSIILAVFLAGLGLGSTAGAALARWLPSPRFALAFCQATLVAAIAWVGYQLSTLPPSMPPYLPVKSLNSTEPWITFQLDLVRCAWAILPAACLWGASFPLALAGVAAGKRDAGRVVSGIYAANTVGAIAGALLFSLIVIGHVGTQHAQQWLIVIAAAAAVLIFLSAFWPARGAKPSMILLGRIVAAAGILATADLAWSLIQHLPPTRWELVAYGRRAHEDNGNNVILFMGEGMNSSVAVTKIVDEQGQETCRNFHVSGKVEASSEPQDMRLQRMLGHLPALFHPHPQSVLVVGCGAGVTAGCFTLHPTMQRIVICEIEPLVPHVVAQFFAKENYGVVNWPKTQIVLDDARHFVLTTHEKFDIITSDPINPWVKGAASLYTKEYFEMCRAHLNPGGFVSQWVPLYESTPEAVKSEIATFFNVFPHGTIWSNETPDGGYDIVLVGQVEPLKIDVDQMIDRLGSPEYAAVSDSLREVGFFSAPNLLATYAGRRADLAPWLADAQLNRDGNLRLQYLAGLGVNTYDSAGIFNQILAYNRYPEDIFTASEQQRLILIDLISRR